MALWETIKDWVVPGRQARAMIIPSEDWPGLVPSHWAGYPTSWRTPYWNTTGDIWSTEVWERASVVFAAVDLISRTLSQMPIRAMKAGLETPERPKWMYDPAPGLYASSNEFTDNMVVSLLMRGNAFIYSLNEYSTGYPREMVVLNPDQIRIEDEGGYPTYYTTDGVRIDTRGDEMNRLLHIKYMSWPGDLWGYGPLDALGRSLGIYRSLDEYASELSGGGAIPWGVLTTDAEMSREQATLMKERWLEASAERHGAPAILSGGMKLQALQLKPSDMMLLDVSQMSERRIAATFGVAPYLLGIPIEGSSSMMQYANVTMIADMLWRMTLRPLANTLSSALSQWALPYGSEVMFDSDSFIRPDAKTRAETLSILIEHGILDVEEARRYQGLPPREANVDLEHIIHQPGQEVL